MRSRKTVRILWLVIVLIGIVSMIFFTILPAFRGF